MRIVLIAPPRKNIVTAAIPENIDEERGFIPPLGLLYIASYVKANSSHEITVIDSEVEGLSYAGLQDRIKALNPDVVGIQVLTFTLIDALKTASIVKDYSKDVPVVFGGPHVTIYPEETLAHGDVDYIVRGEGEISFKKLVDSLGNEVALETISGVGFKNKGNLKIAGQPLFIDNIDSLPIPDRTLTPYRQYYSILSKNFPITTMMTSRGCPYNCIFCERMGKKFRANSSAKVIEEIEDCLRLGIKEIFLHDDTFTVDKKRVFEICDMIKRKRLKFVWDARARVDTVTYELLRAMKESGCSRISFGVESGNAKVLRNLRKGVTIEQVETAFRYAKDLKIQTLADFMLGSPGETREDLEETIRFAKRLNPDYAQFSITTPYPGTDLYREALKGGLIKSDVWRKFAISPDAGFKVPLWNENFSRQELLELSDMAYKRFYLSARFLLKEITGVRSIREFMKKIKAGMKLLK